MRCSVAYLHVIVYIFSGLGTWMCVGYTASLVLLIELWDLVVRFPGILFFGTFCTRTWSTKARISSGIYLTRVTCAI